MTARGALAADRVEVWSLALDRLGDDAVARYHALLDADERARAERFYFEGNRREYIAAHGLLRVMLGTLAGADARAWHFTAEAQSKPRIAAPTDWSGLTFNLSHTVGLVACAAALDREVGVDVECLAREGRSLEIADSYFAPSEAALVRAAPQARRQEVFLSLWTLKEAYMKATGQGFGVPLGDFAFELDPIRVAFAPGLADDPARWTFRQLRPTDVHLLAVAAQRSDGAAVEIVHRHFTEPPP